MFGITYTEEVTIRRPVQGSLGVAGRPDYEVLKYSDDETPVCLRCSIEERGRVTIDARQRQLRTDATLLYSPKGKETLQDTDIVVRADGRAYEVVGIETVSGQWGTPAHSRVDLAKTTIAVPGGGA